MLIPVLQFFSLKPGWSSLGDEHLDTCLHRIKVTWKVTTISFSISFPLGFFLHKADWGSVLGTLFAEIHLQTAANTELDDPFDGLVLFFLMVA